LTGATHPRIAGCRVIDPNQDQSNGHVMGCIGFSNAVSDATITDCLLSGGVAGIGAIDSSDNSDVTISDCTIRNATGAGIDMLDGTASNTPARVTITNCRIYACPYAIRVSETQGASSTWPSQLLITGCYFDGSTTQQVKLDNCQYVTLTGCQFNTASTSLIQLLVNGAQFVNVSGCVFSGGGYGVYAEPSILNPDTINITGNTFTGQHAQSIHFEDNTLNSTITDNLIKNSDGTDVGYLAIVAYGPTVVSGNAISLAVAGQVGIQPNQSTASGGLDGVRVLGNAVKGSGTWLQPFGAAAQIIMGNVYQSSLSGGNVGTTGTALPQLTFSGTHSGALQTGAGAITVNSSGAGIPDGTYNLIFVGGGGSGAAGTATFAGGTITGTNVTAGGANYTSAPKVYVTVSVSINNIAA
jgi:hypothetical protein